MNFHGFAYLNLAKLIDSANGDTGIWPFLVIEGVYVTRVFEIILEGL